MLNSVNNIIKQKDRFVKDIIDSERTKKVAIFCKSRFDLQNVYTKICLGGWCEEQVFIYDKYYFDAYYQEILELIDDKDNIIVLTNTMDKDFLSKFEVVHVY